MSPLQTFRPSSSGGVSVLEHSLANGNPKPCFGVFCHKHAHCQHYEAVDGSDPEQAVLGNCGPGLPLYLVAVPA